MNYPVLAAAPGGSSPRVLPMAHPIRQGFGDGRPLTRFMPPSEVPFILSVKEAAGWLGIHHDTLRDHAAKSRVKCLRIGGRLCFRRDELLAGMERAGRSK